MRLTSTKTYSSTARCRRTSPIVAKRPQKCLAMLNIFFGRVHRPAAAGNAVHLNPSWHQAATLTLGSPPRRASCHQLACARAQVLRAPAAGVLQRAHAGGSCLPRAWAGRNVGGSVPFSRHRYPLGLVCPHGPARHRTHLALGG